jgi:hypothetical protein
MVEELDKKTPNVKLVDFSWIVIYLFLGRIVIFCKDFLKRCKNYWQKEEDFG